MAANASSRVKELVKSSYRKIFLLLCQNDKQKRKIMTIFRNAKVLEQTATLIITLPTRMK
jgi:hypothetical protein